jgi:hypothetical protein
MIITRLFTGDDGESHFPPGHVLDWHPAPRRQYVLTLSGEHERRSKP